MPPVWVVGGYGGLAVRVLQLTQKDLRRQVWRQDALDFVRSGSWFEDICDLAGMDPRLARVELEAYAPVGD